MNYIQKTAGFKIAAIKEGGSRGKQTTSIFSLLEFIIMNKDLNDNIIKDEDLSNNLCFPTSKISILKFGRFSELLSNDYEEFIHNHINFIKVVLNYFKENKKIVLTIKNVK